MSRYAEGTSVPVGQSQADVQNLLRRFGATEFALGWSARSAVVSFVAHQRQLRFRVPMPELAEVQLTAGGVRRSPAAAQSALEQEQRRRWRALLLVLKAKLESVSSGIVTFEEEFLAHVVMPDGATVAEHVAAPIEAAYSGGRIAPLLREVEA